MRTLALIFLFSVSSLAADIYAFSLIPAGGNIGGAPGAPIGWGYSIENQSSSLWLVTTNLDGGVFQHGTPSIFFDFPDLAPGETVTVTYDAALFTGLQQLVWDTTAPVGFINSGSFVLGAEWWSGDPLNSGQFQFVAPDASASYTATVVTPEPATGAIAVLAAVAFAGAGLIRKR